MKVAFTLNGDQVTWDVHPGETFFETLKMEGHYSAKRGCNTGDCGVCIVTLDGENIHSCQIFSGSVEGQCVRTIDGIVYRNKKTGEVIVKDKVKPAETSS
ncbi:MAG: 2Fe-2S iron-sulfur cluster-binding protein [Candidatus Hydrogenedentota bacterium]